MRIVVDFQAAQTGSRYRGIGHYSTELVKSLIRNSPGDEFILALSGLFTDSIEPIRAAFDGFIPQQNIRVWHTPGPIEQFGSHPGNLREAAEAIREYFLRSLDPDLILVTSVFEGLSDNAVMTVKKFVTDVPVAAIFYDLTPLYMPDEQFQINPVFRRWYRHRIEQLRRCDLLMAISESSRREVIEKLQFPPDHVVNIFGGRSEAFVRREYQPMEKDKILRKFGIEKPYILYAGGIEANKNLKSLVAALSYLPADLQKKYELICVGKRYPGEVELIRGWAVSAETREMIKLVGFVSQDDLIDLYNCCDLFVFPSFREGLGLPPLEAMACGAATITSDRTSLPEVVGNPQALFDPASVQSIAAKITQVLTDETFKQDLVNKGLQRAAELTWDRTGSIGVEAIALRFKSKRHVDATRRTVVSRTSLFKPNEKRILAIKLDHNGDFLLAIPAFAKLRARYPNARIDVVVGSWNRLAAESAGLFDNIYTLDYFKAKSSLNASLQDEELESLLAKLIYYDYAIDFRRQSETRFLLYKISAAQYFGYRTSDGKRDDLLTNPLSIHPDAAGERSYFDETHICEQMLKIVDALPFHSSDYLKLPDIGTKLPVVQGSVAIFPRVGNDSRQWDSEYFARLIDALAGDQTIRYINLYVGTETDLDVISYRPSEKIRIQAGLDFKALYSSLSANQVCVGNNSFGAHLAGYVGCRTIGIYSGHELHSQWGPPFGDSLAVSVDAPCAPCHLPDRPSCPFDLFCLNDISVETVRSLVREAVTGKALRENYSKMNSDNPATAVKPLVDAINRSSFFGLLSGLTNEQRVGVAASISANFPERDSTQPCIYVDVSGLVTSPSAHPRTNAALLRVRAILDELSVAAGRRARVVPIATGPHDHEFYVVDVNELEQSLFGEDRANRIVLPLAGDSYLGVDPYWGRNAAQWNLLVAWRQAGVLVAFNAPQDLDKLFASQAADSGGDLLAAYMFYIAQFDAIIAPDATHTRLKAWLEEHGPPRLRPLRLSAAFVPQDLQALRIPTTGPVDGSATARSVRDVPSVI